MSFVKAPPRIGIDPSGITRSDLAGFDTAVKDLPTSLGVVSDIRVDLGVTDDSFTLQGPSLDDLVATVPFIPELLEEGRQRPAARASVMLDENGVPVNVSNGPVYLAAGKQRAASTNPLLSTILRDFELVDIADALRRLEAFASSQNLNNFPILDALALHRVFISRQFRGNEAQRMAAVLGQIARLNPNLFAEQALEAIDRKAGTKLVVEKALMERYGITRASIASPYIPHSFRNGHTYGYVVVNDPKTADYYLYVYDSGSRNANPQFVRELMEATGNRVYDEGTFRLVDNGVYRTAEVSSGIKDMRMMAIVDPLMKDAFMIMVSHRITYSYPLAALQAELDQ